MEKRDSKVEELMRWMVIVIWREIVGKEDSKVEEVNEMDGIVI